MPYGVDTRLFGPLFDALSTTVVGPHDDWTPDYLRASNDCYLRLIYFLTKNKDWRQRLTQNGHVQQCIRLYPTFSEGDVCIAGICLHIDPSGNDPALGSIHERLGELIRRAWRELSCIIISDVDLHDYLEILPALVTAMKQKPPRSDDGVADLQLNILALNVGWVLQGLQALEGLDGNILSTVQSFSNDLNRMVSTWPNTQ